MKPDTSTVLLILVRAVLYLFTCLAWTPGYTEQAKQEQILRDTLKELESK